MLQNSPYGDNALTIPTITTSSTITPSYKPVSQPQPPSNLTELQTNLTKPHVPFTFIILPAPILIPTHIPITKFLPTPTPLLRASPTQTPSNSHHKDTISLCSTLLWNHPLTPYNTTTRMISQFQKYKPNTHDQFDF